MLQRRTPAAPTPKVALLMSGPHACLMVDLLLIKALELAGFSTVVLILNERYRDRYYRLAGASRVCTWDEFIGPQNHAETAKAVVGRSLSMEALAQFEHAGARVGRIALSTALRELRLGTLDLAASPTQRQHLASVLARSMSLADASRTLIRRVAPDCAVFNDTVYLRRGELFDLCLLGRIPTHLWHPAHKNNCLILKRYSLANRDHHPVSLSPESWQQIERMAWTDAHRARLQGEFSAAYAKGDWYGESGTQFRKRPAGRTDIEGQLGLVPAKKNAFIFAHIVWDAPFSWGENLFETHEQWLIETVRAACRNDKVNWVIKIHPANVGKQLKERFSGEPAEVIALRKHFSELPPHIFVMPAESEVSTHALFAMMDFCITVRGTIGIEAASFGIPVVTAGTGRYDRRGFTVDCASRAAYLSTIANIHDLAPLGPSARALAERFAYGTFILRPFPLETISLEFGEAFGAKNDFVRSSVNAVSKSQWDGAADLHALSRWLGGSGDGDFLADHEQYQGASH